ncbi:MULTISPECIES: hypothetical protein [Mesorhizobium]|uniref:Uncharacterized protein n=1 Tax=Mesorhizobium denitrificans TaxID=2294114 RepID=A0A371XCR4_9HYPH|nr:MULTISPECIES: hypothetical protein [Mesorhizobium]RFC67012.1 hypothetical protein DY251_14370 [Mesorhizobium denitrificans]
MKTLGQGASLPKRGHNGGPRLDNERSSRPWGKGPVGTYYYWRAAHDAAWRNIPRDTVLRRLERAASIGLTWREYTLEILERGRYLSLPDDSARIAEIKAARRSRRRMAD